MINTDLYMEMTALFENIVMTDSLRYLSSIFPPQDNSPAYMLDYKPAYQRNYVWNDVKATYLIESILLHGEIPPIVVYEKGKVWEVIDGRQRCETIDRFLKGSFSLKLHGLDNLWNLGGKRFHDLEEPLKARIYNTQLRVIIIKARNEQAFTARSEMLLKREIFKRYNLGITPLKKEEVFKAQYIQDKVNIYFKEQFEEQPIFYQQVAGLFEHRKRNLEVMMQHIRQLLVLHHIPLNKFMYGREDIVNKYYGYLSFRSFELGGTEKVKEVFDEFKLRCNFLKEIKDILEEKGLSVFGNINDCLYWALAVCQQEKISFHKINSPVFKAELIAHLVREIGYYANQSKQYWENIKNQCNRISRFFSMHLDIDFLPYLKGSEEFVATTSAEMNAYMEQNFNKEKLDAHFTKQQSSSLPIADILTRMKQGNFLLRPDYQRMEVMVISKASSLIESLLLGLKFHPIFIYRRKDGTMEVLDGQQRLLSVIGFLGESYRNEHGQTVKSKKHKFSLHLKMGILRDLHGKKFEDLEEDQQMLIKNFEINVIEIKEENNEKFKPEELFKRLNYKPVPIKENTFEFWNAYIDNDIIEAIKLVYQRNAWLYLRKDDIRMRNEGFIACLCFLHYFTRTDRSIEGIRQVLQLYRNGSSTVVRLKEISIVTHVLEDATHKGPFLQALYDMEMDFIEKLKLLVSSNTGRAKEYVSDRRLDALLETGRVRIAGNFYMLWAILQGIPMEYILESPEAVLQRIEKVVYLIKISSTPEKVAQAIKDTWQVNEVVINSGIDALTDS